MKHAVISAYRQSFTKKGRASRSEYWYFALFYLVMDVASQMLTRYGLYENGKNHGSMVVFLAAITLSLVVLFSVIPFLAVQTRRLHDVGRSGWWVGVTIIYSAITEGVVMVDILAAMRAHDVGHFLYSFVQGQHIGLVIAVMGLMALAITIFIFMVLPGTPGVNQYGKNPLDGPCDRANLSVGRM
ncbi:MAG: DUF805 domain-containing protein [Acidiferrobacter sp.]